MSALETFLSDVSGSEWRWFVKYLSGNDTLLTEAHQAGPYVPKSISFRLFPKLASPDQNNPRAFFDAVIESHQEAPATPNIIWYNNTLRGGTRDECRITGWGGRKSPLLDPDSTGSLCVFAFRSQGNSNPEFCRIWLCADPSEEDTVLGRTGPVEPGGGVLVDPSDAFRAALIAERDSPCRLARADIPDAWLTAFPAAEEIVDFAVGRLPSLAADTADKRLIRRRACEFDVFLSVEEAHVLPRIREGFRSVDLFVAFANSVMNRRKARSGMSLELHARRVFDEEGVTYSHDEISEGNKRPDFLFPSAEAYHDPAHPAERLVFLGVKTTCKDRWRQIINEADRIPAKHLLTLQEGVSANQLEEMEAHGVRLVVPKPLHKRYPESWRARLLSFDDFIRRTASAIS